MSKSILVAGGAGFIGSHTAKMLARMGYEPVVLDNLVTGNRSAVRFGPFYENSIEDAEAVRRIVRTHDIGDAILLAGHAYVGESTSQPRKYFTNNVSNNLSLLNTLLDAGVSRLVFSSSCSVYGEAASKPAHRRQSDRAAEPLCGIQVVSGTRPGVVWPRVWLALGVPALFQCGRRRSRGELGEHHEPETHLVPLAIQAARNGERLPIFGDDYPTPDGTCIRDYVHVSDLARAHVQAIEYLTGGGQDAAINLGTGKGNSVREVIREVEALRQARAVHREATESWRRAVLVANYDKAKRVLGWKPCTSDLGTVVRTAWNWFAGSGARAPGAY